MRGSKIGWEQIGCVGHMESESHSYLIAKGDPAYPTAVGRQVSLGMRQSMPESR
jgi:hypothetical protein